MLQSFCSWIYLWGFTTNEGCLYSPVYMPIFLVDYNQILGKVVSFHLHIFWAYSNCLAPSALFSTGEIWGWATSQNAWSFIWNLFWACACVSLLNSLKTLTEMSKMLIISQRPSNLQFMTLLPFTLLLLLHDLCSSLLCWNSVASHNHTLSNSLNSVPSLCFTCLTINHKPG